LTSALSEEGREGDGVAPLEPEACDEAAGDCLVGVFFDGAPSVFKLQASPPNVEENNAEIRTCQIGRSKAAL